MRKTALLSHYLLAYANKSPFRFSTSIFKSIISTWSPHMAALQSLCGHYLHKLPLLYAISSADTRHKRASHLTYFPPYIVVSCVSWSHMMCASSCWAKARKQRAPFDHKQTRRCRKWAVFNRRRAFTSRRTDRAYICCRRRRRALVFANFAHNRFECTYINNRRTPRQPRTLRACATL